MERSRDGVRLPFLAAVLKRVIQSGLRGSTRLSLWLAGRASSLHRVPVQVADGQVMYLDMREAWCRDLLCGPLRSGPPRWEPDEQLVMRRLVRPGEVAFDIGARFGEHSILLAQLVGPRGRLVAFEPDPERVEALDCTVGQLGNGRLLTVALSDSLGRRSLFVPENRSMASLADWTAGSGGAVRAIECEETPLDRLVDQGTVPRPDFVKCDVEGAESLVFRGARRMLDRADAPIVMYEANEAASAAFGDSLAASTAFLTSLSRPRYSIYWVRPGGALQPLEAFPSNVSLLNLVAVPAAERHRLEI